jgi:hypothetical protein
MGPGNRALPGARERGFGVSVGIVCCLVAAYLLWRGRFTGAQIAGGLGTSLVILGLLRPSLLKVPSDLWWAFSHALGWLNARVILTSLFVVLLTPVGLLWRVTGKDPLRRRRQMAGGWMPYPARYRDRKHYERMF